MHIVEQAKQTIHVSHLTRSVLVYSCVCVSLTDCVYCDCSSLLFTATCERFILYKCPTMLHCICGKEIN